MVTLNDVKENDGICVSEVFQKMSVIIFLSWLLRETKILFSDCGHTPISASPSVKRDLRVPFQRQSFKSKEHS